MGTIPRAVGVCNAILEGVSMLLIAPRTRNDLTHLQHRNYELIPYHLICVNLRNLRTTLCEISHRDWRIIRRLHRFTQIKEELPFERIRSSSSHYGRQARIPNIQWIFLPPRPPRLRVTASEYPIPVMRRPGRREFSIDWVFLLMP